MKFDPERQLAFQSPAAIRAEQERLLNEHLAYCREHSPYYRNRLPAGPVRLEDLAGLPTVSRADLSRDNAAFVAVPDDRIADISFTSGTTGQPCRFVYTRRDLERLALNDATGFWGAGMRPGMKVLLTCTIDRCFIAGLAYYSGAVLLGASAIRNGLNTIESHAQIIRTQKPEAIVGVPSFLVKLLDYLREQEKMDLSFLKTLVCIGEPLRTRELGSTALARRLEALVPEGVHATYASTEMGTSFTECSARCGGHAPADLAIVEVVDEAGHPVPPGQTGEITCTPLQVEGMPLVRFRTGDIGFLIPEPCACGRHTPRVGPVVGRKAQMLKVRGTLLFPSAFAAVLDAIPEIREYYLTVSGDELSDRVEVTVAGDGPLDTARITEQLYGHIRIHIPVVQADLAAARQKIYGFSRKPVRFFDQRKPAL